MRDISPARCRRQIAGIDRKLALLRRDRSIVKRDSLRATITGRIGDLLRERDYLRFMIFRYERGDVRG